MLIGHPTSGERHILFLYIKSRKVCVELPVKTHLAIIPKNVKDVDITLDGGRVVACTCR